MGATFTSLHIHVVFSTKERKPHISELLRPRLYDYMGGLVRGEEAALRAIGGRADHVHLLVGIRPDRTISGLVRQVKAVSSGWIHQTFPDRQDFRWQTGFGAFSVSESQMDKVSAYILGQERHHREFGFKDELRALLNAHNIAFDETYIWR